MNKKNIEYLMDTIEELMFGLSETIDRLDLAETIWDKNIDPKLKDNDVLEDVLNNKELAVLNCTRIRQILIAVRYAIGNPQVIPDLQENTIISTMRHSISNNEATDETVDKFLDYMNLVKKQKSY
tara:strand:+ start:866 stop:1240 length:375 start_codon:yes stop_codon:yes gene_type:complete